MLIEFTASNFRSILDPVTLTLIASKLDSKNADLSEGNLHPVNDSLSLLNSVIVYGGNASGKSNIFKAFRFFKTFIQRSSQEGKSDSHIDVEPFLFRDSTKTNPSSFEAVFIIDGLQYRYGFEVSTEKVHKEWLYSAKKVKESTLFTRVGDEFHIPSSSLFKEGRGLAERTRQNALFINVAAQFNGEISNKILKWISSCAIVSGSSDFRFSTFTQECLKDGKFKPLFRKLIKDLDLGIEDVTVVEEPVADEVLRLTKVLVDAIPSLAGLPDLTNETTLSLETHHTIRNEDGDIIGIDKFPIDRIESEGTRKIIALCGPLFDTLSKGDVIFIDEIDSKLHPLLTAKIIGLFNSKVTNPRGAQLICATHDTNLLDSRKIRRDQIFFTEKIDDATKLYSLADFKIAGKRVRVDESYEKNYIQGRYGAIPYISNIDSIFSQEDSVEVEAEQLSND